MAPSASRRLGSCSLDSYDFTVDEEIALMREHRIDVVVTKDSGGSMTAAKLTAARELELPVVLVRRPSVPPRLIFRFRSMRVMYVQKSAHTAPLCRSWGR